MRELIINGKEIKFAGRVARATWTDEAETDLKKFHNVDVSKEISQALVNELDREFALTEEERVYCLNKLLTYFG